MIVAEWIAVLLASYAGVVIAFEALVMAMGARQAARGVQPGEDWLVVATSDAQGSRETVVAAWRGRSSSMCRPTIGFADGIAGRSRTPMSTSPALARGSAYRAVPVGGAERGRIARGYRIPRAIRFLTGFPPRSFLRLDRR